MKITLIVEGKTEREFVRHLRTFLEPRLAGRMPTLAVSRYDGHIPTDEKLKRRVRELLREPSDHVVALTDIYTGDRPPRFTDAADAKSKMHRWVGNEPRFHPHAAQFEIEAWLLPYWPRIQGLARHNQAAPSGEPESINHNNPPARRITEIFGRGGARDYVKTRDFAKILQNQDLSLAIERCPELKSLVNSIMRICDGDQIP